MPKGVTWRRQKYTIEKMAKNGIWWNACSKWATDALSNKTIDKIQKKKFLRKFRRIWLNDSSITNSYRAIVQNRLKLLLFFIIKLVIKCIQMNLKHYFWYLLDNIPMLTLMFIALIMHCETSIAYSKNHWISIFDFKF